MNGMEFDLVVFGGGPAGISGANAAAMFGKRVAIIEKARVIGGAGINSLQGDLNDLSFAGATKHLGAQ